MNTQHFREEALKHISILKKDFEAIKEMFPITTEDIEKMTSSEESLRLLDQIAYRHIKLQDTLGKLIRSYLRDKGENVEELSTIDLINLMEKRGYSINENLWLRMRSLRSTLTHDYTETGEQIAQALNELYKLIPRLEGLLKEMGK